MDEMKCNPTISTLVILLAVGLIVGATERGQTVKVSGDGEVLEWPQWRGPNRDGVAILEGLGPQSWPEQLTLEWKVDVGVGYASPVISGGLVYMHTRKEDSEVITALEAETGKVVWQDTYPAPYEVNPEAERHGPGPKSTPVVHDGKVFTFGLSGILSALDATNGSVLWRKDAPTVGPLYGTAMSPIVDGKFVIAHVGGHDGGALTAFDVDSGIEQWVWEGDGPGYSSPVIGTFLGSRQVITYTQNYLVGIDIGNGALLWRIPFTTPYIQNSITPIVDGDMIYSSGLEQGMSALRVIKTDNQWAVEPVWENQDVSFYMSSPVFTGDLLFGLSARRRGQWVCLDAKTGETLWMSEGREAENAALVWSGDVLFLLRDDGKLIVARPSPIGFEPLQNYRVAESETWAHPAILGGNMSQSWIRIFVKDLSSVALWGAR